jgi:hypothetical protein
MDETGSPQTASERQITIPPPLLESGICHQSACRFNFDIDQPGFYIAATRLHGNNSEGMWGLGFATTDGLNQGGFNSGAVLKENGDAPGYMAFYLLRSESITLTPFEYTGNVSSLLLKISRQDLFTGERQTVFGPLAATPGTAYNTITLASGFYVAEVSSRANDPRGRFGLSVNAASIVGGVNVGGWIDSYTGSNGEGFGALYIATPQTVEVTTLFGDSYSSLGSGYVQLDIYQVQPDGQRVLYFTSEVTP